MHIAQATRSEAANHAAVGCARRMRTNTSLRSEVGHYGDRPDHPNTMPQTRFPTSSV